MLDRDENVVPVSDQGGLGPCDRIASLSDDAQPAVEFTIEGISFPGGNSICIRAIASTNSRIEALSEDSPLKIKNLELNLKAAELFKWCALQQMLFAGAS